MRKTVWGKCYNKLEIRSDFRVHDCIADKLRTRLNQNHNNRLNTSIIDIATGSGALAQRIIDENANISIDVNDIEGQCKISSYRKIFSVDLNSEFFESFDNETYDIILAVEIIEHLKNPWAFLGNISKLLKPGGIIMLSTPNTNSFLDRLSFLLYGHEFYFGQNGYMNSSGHISPVPDWKFNLICSESGLKVIDRDLSITVYPLIGILTSIKIVFLGSFGQLFSLGNNQVSINIYECGHDI